MKFAALLLCFIVAASACVHDDGNGKPLCNGVTSHVGSNYRNNVDPNSYWHCASENTPVSMKCPTEKPMYYVVKDACVTSGVWRWTPPCKPDA